MSTSKKHPASIRHGGPGAAHENAKEPTPIDKPPADADTRQRSRISGGGGESDSHHTHAPNLKGTGRR